MRKEYSNGEITLVWKPDLCIHSGKCVQGLGDVFDPKRKPWIDVSQASSNEIITQVGKCPSGALSIKDDNMEAAGNEKTKVQLMPGGPLVLKGICEVIAEDGQAYEKKNVAFCRCTKSANFPYCDGSHKN